MNNFISQNKSAFKKKKKRWQPKGRQVENNILEEINTRIYKLDEYLNYLDSSGEITLYNDSMDTVKSLDDICHIFIDKKLHLKIKDKIYKIYDFKYKEI